MDMYKSNRGQYPLGWKHIARMVKVAAGWKCEHCGHPNDWESGHVLTVHHLDLDPANCDETNLVALCQRCHLSIQAKWRPGQPWLFDPPVWAIRRGHADS